MMSNPTANDLDVVLAPEKTNSEYITAPTNL